MQLWLEEGISDYKYLTYLGHKDLQIIKNIEEKYSPDLKLFAKNILLSTFKFSKRDFINITLVTLTFTPLNINPVTFRMNVVEAFIYKSIYWPQYHTKLSFDEFKVKFGFDSSYLYSLATTLVTPFNSMELYKITILPKKTAKLNCRENVRSLLEPLILLNVRSIPMISSPLPWTFNGFSWIGGRYRHDIHPYNLIYKNSAAHSLHFKEGAI